VLNLKKIKNIQENLEESSSALDRIQKSLNDYLETKRQYFPRFYFLSNEDLLEILGESKKPQKVQRHLKKCFEGINEVVFKSASKDNEGDEEIIAIVSREQERIELVKSIFPHDYKGNVEQWLLELEKQMKLSV
jgi:dynein heavy chain